MQNEKKISFIFNLKNSEIKSKKQIMVLFHELLMQNLYLIKLYRVFRMNAQLFLQLIILLKPIYQTIIVDSLFCSKSISKFASRLMT